jgi:hypothetical protein
MVLAQSWMRQVRQKVRDAAARASVSYWTGGWVSTWIFRFLSADTYRHSRLNNFTLENERQGCGYFKSILTLRAASQLVQTVEIVALHSWAEPFCVPQRVR